MTIHLSFVVGKMSKIKGKSVKFLKIIVRKIAENFFNLPHFFAKFL